jgi:hypothetical protein
LVLRKRLKGTEMQCKVTANTMMITYLLIYFASLSVYLSICLSVYLSICLSVSVSERLSVCLHMMPNLSFNPFFLLPLSYSLLSIDVSVFLHSQCPCRALRLSCATCSRGRENDNERENKHEREGGGLGGREGGRESPRERA